ncbi:MAG: hypothetical protein LAT54_05805 [Cryomorphaceae bacterium]|nr:hypothetical protein [Cryomorphaceae bacterium]
MIQFNTTIYGKLKGKWLLLLCIFASVQVINAQQLQFYNGEFTVMDTVKGNATYAFYQISEDSVQLQGEFKFLSDLYQEENVLNVKKVSIQGNFRRGVKRGNWEYEQSYYTVTLNRIRNLNLESTLNGMQLKISGSYVNGKANGVWQTKRVQVVDNKPQGSSVNSRLNFVDGIASGNFSYDMKVNGEPLTITGKFSDNGFMDGLWKMRYTRDSITVIEERNYSDGILTDLIKIEFNEGKSDTVASVSFIDAKDRLVGLLSKTESLNFKLGEKGFGVLFDNGYRRNDIRRRSQEDGNAFLEEVLKVFDAKKSVIGAVADPTPPTINFTRRFEYVYPENEDSIIDVMKPLLDNMSKHVDTLLDNPTFDINRRTDTLLAKGYAFVRLAQDKVERSKEVIKKINEGEFQFTYRDSYYSKGVPGLNEADTLEYTVDGKKKILVFQSDYYVDSPDDLVDNIYKFLRDLDDQLNDKLKNVEGVIVERQKEQKIYEMDLALIKTFRKLSSIYGNVEALNDTVETIIDPMDVEMLFTKDKTKQASPLQLALYERFVDNKKDELLTKYSGEEDFEEKLKIGKQLLDMMNALIDVFPVLSEIDLMPEQLDSNFTIYTENPFFERKMESKILTNIYSKGVKVLLPHLVDELKLYRSGGDIRIKVEEIVALRKRLNELVDYPEDNQDVRRLDRRLRRENVPARIKRLLGL